MTNLFILETIHGKPSNKQYRYKFATCVQDDIFSNIVAVNPDTRRNKGYLKPQYNQLANDVMDYCEEQSLELVWNTCEFRTDYINPNGSGHYTNKQVVTYELGPLSEHDALLFALMFGQYIVRDKRSKRRKDIKPVSRATTAAMQYGPIYNYTIRQVVAQQMA